MLLNISLDGRIRTFSAMPPATALGELPSCLQCERISASLSQRPRISWAKAAGKTGFKYQKRKLGWDEKRETGTMETTARSRMRHDGVSASPDYPLSFVREGRECRSIAEKKRFAR